MHSKIYLYRLLFILFSGLVISMNANATNDKTTPFSDPDKAIVVASNQPEFTLKLKSNPTTGYSWFLLEHDALIISVKHEYIAPTSQLAGAPGYELWTFKLKPDAFVVPQILALSMTYTRPWQARAGEEVKFVVVTK